MKEKMISIDEMIVKKKLEEWNYFLETGEVKDFYMELLPGFNVSLKVWEEIVNRNIPVITKGTFNINDHRVWVD